MYAALAPKIAASLPCARLEPNSSTTRPFAARQTRFAFVAMRLWWLSVRSKNVSTSCASIAGARTVRIGSFGKIGVPSGTAQISPVKRKLFR